MPSIEEVYNQRRGTPPAEAPVGAPTTGGSAAERYRRRKRNIGRPAFEGGFVSDVFDALLTGERASAALVGSMANSDAGTFSERFKSADTNYANLLREWMPDSRKSPWGRRLTGAAGFVLGTVLDPTTYVGAGLVGKLGKVAKAGGATGAAARLGLVAADPVGQAFGGAMRLAEKQTVHQGLSQWAIKVAENKVRRAELDTMMDIATIREGQSHRAAQALAENVRKTLTGKAEALTGGRVFGVAGTGLGASDAAVTAYRDMGRSLTDIFDKPWEAGEVTNRLFAAEVRRRGNAVGRMVRGAKARLKTAETQGASARRIQAESERHLNVLNKRLVKLWKRLPATGPSGSLPKVPKNLQAEIKRVEQEIRYHTKRATTLQRRADKWADRAASATADIERAKRGWYSKAARAQRANARTAVVTNAQDQARERAFQAAQNVGLDRPTAEGLYRSIDDREEMLRQWLVGSGVLNPAVLSKWKGIHLWRGYAKHQTPEDWIDFMETADPHEASRALSSGMRRTGSNAIPGAIKKQRTLLPEDARIKAGEIWDPGARILFGQGLAARAASRAELYGQAAQRFGTSEAAAAAIENLSGTSLFRQMQGPKWGALNDQWVPKNIHDELKWRYAIGDAGTMGHMMAMAQGNKPYRSALTGWKAMKTIWNPAVHGRNFLSNMWRGWTEAGMDPARFTGRFVQAMRELKRNGKWAQEFFDNTAAAHDTFFQREFRRSVYDFDVDAGPLAALKRVNTGAGRAYNAVEQAGKLAVYMEARARGMSPWDAGKLAEKTLFNYGKAPKAAEFLAQTGAAPLIRYTSMAIPAEAQAMLREPGRYARLPRLFETVQSSAGDDPERVSSERRMQPGWMQGGYHLRLPAMGSNPRPNWLDATYIVPWVGNTPTDPTDPAGGLLAQGWQMINPALRTFGELAINRPATIDREIVTAPDRGSLEAMGQRAEYVGKAILPNWTPGIGYGAEDFYSALTGQLDRQLEDKSVARSALANALGIKTRPMDEQDERNALSYEASRMKRRYSTEARKLNEKYRRNQITDEEYDAGMQYLIDSEREAMLQLIVKVSYNRIYPSAAQEGGR